MKQLPAPGIPGRRRREQAAFARLYAATGERIATAEDNLTEAGTYIDIIRAAAAKAGLPFTSKGDTR